MWTRLDESGRVHTCFDMYEADLYAPCRTWLVGLLDQARMTDQRPPKPSWGASRTAFVSLLDTIRAEIGQGLLLATIHDRHKSALGISYSGFCKLVARYADDAKPLKARPAGAVPKAPSPAPVQPASPIPAKAEMRPHARHEPAGRPDFKHHGIVQEGEPEQLFGPGFLPKRRG